MNGFSKPEYIFPSVVGISKLTGKTSLDLNPKYGLDAYKNLPNMNISYPLEYPNEIEWEDFTDLIVETLPLLNTNNVSEDISRVKDS